METLGLDAHSILPPMSNEKAREILISHSRSPRNHRKLETTSVATAKNPACGDEVTVQMIIHNCQITEAAIQVKACTICTASASLLSDFVKNRQTEEILNLSKLFQDQISKQDLISASWPMTLAPLQSLEHLKINKTRMACGILPWVALDKILKG